MHRLTTHRLAQESSRYLRQHAADPVDWYPWSPTALDAAGAQGVPILLSIGYSTCHWCHEMARTTFSDQAVAQLMNQHFVCIKVDREERPDLDEFGLSALRSLGVRPGWPITIFLTPDLQPFFGGTYFPPSPQGGLPGFRDVLDGLATLWRDNRGTAIAKGKRLVGDLNSDRPTEPLDRGAAGALTEHALSNLAEVYDGEHGGFGRHSKFPRAPLLEFVLHCSHIGLAGASSMLRTTLDAMACGQLYDHVGGGFHRYCEGRDWTSPHFEKTLYDNAQLAQTYLRAWQLCGELAYRRIAEETLDYAVRELTHSQGGFLSGQDSEVGAADGAYYRWSGPELRATVGPDAASFFSCQQRSHDTAPLILSVPDLTSWRDGDRVLDRGKLLRRRALRTPPSMDNKVVTAWNALAITAFARAGRALDRRDYLDAAIRAAEFIMTSCRRADGSLARSWTDGHVGGRGYLDDHAAFGLSCLALYEATTEARWLDEAVRLADVVTNLHHDKQSGKFSMSAADEARLPVQLQGIDEVAQPSGTALALDLLMRIGHLYPNRGYQPLVEQTIAAVGTGLVETPETAGAVLTVADMCCRRIKTLVIAAGNTDSWNAMMNWLWPTYLPNVVLAFADRGSGSDPPVVAERVAINGRTTAFLCDDTACRQPATDVAGIGEMLRKLS